MDIIKKNINGNECVFYCTSGNTRSGFYHAAELWVNDRFVSSARKNYLNRTWESYRFQSVCLGAVENAIDEARNNIIEDEKGKKGWAKLTAARREQVEKIIDENDGIKGLRELREAVSSARYGTEEERENLESLDRLVKMTEALAELGFFGHATA